MSENKIEIDLDTGRITRISAGDREHMAIGSPEGFSLISDLWLRSNWQNKQTYTFTWLGRPVIQLPEDMVRIQEAIYRVKPDLIVETGIAHGGGTIFLASLCRLLGKGRVVAIDSEIRAHNRTAIEAHELADLITLIEGDSKSENVFEQVSAQVKPDDVVFVFLDSNHSKKHVLAELELYAPLVGTGSYILVADGLMASLAGLERFEDERPTGHWGDDNPVSAVEAFLEKHPEFEIHPPAFAFNESPLAEAVTYCPHGWLRRRS